MFIEKSISEKCRTSMFWIVFFSPILMVFILIKLPAKFIYLSFFNFFSMRFVFCYFKEL